MQLRVITGVVWLAIAVPLLLINITGKPLLGVEPGNLSLLLGLMAVMLGLFRLWSAWVIGRRRNPPPPPVRRRIEHETEYNPEFDFTRREDAS